MARISYTEKEVELLARLIKSEALGEGEEGMLLVGNVIVNRVVANCDIIAVSRASPTAAPAVKPLRQNLSVLPPPLVGEALAVRAGFQFCQRLSYQEQQQQPPPVADKGRCCWGRGQQNIKLDAGSRNPCLPSDSDG